MKVERQVAELQRSAVDAGKLEGSLSAVQNQLQETQGNLSSVKADLQQATNALTSEQAVQVGSNPFKVMHPHLALVTRCQHCGTLPLRRQQQQGHAARRATNSSTGILATSQSLLISRPSKMPSVACRLS